MDETGGKEDRDRMPQKTSASLEVEPHGLKPMASPHASEGRNPPKHTLLRSFRASKGAGIFRQNLL
jgi:hypothetical protein